MRLGDEAKIRTMTEKGWWTQETLADLFSKNAEATPERLAVIDPLNREDVDTCAPRRLTYKELELEIASAERKLTGLGLKQGDIIGLQLANTVEQVILYLAAIRQGIIISPFAIQWREHELRDVLNFVGVKAIITAKLIRGFAHGDLLAKLKAQIPTLDHVLVLGSDAPKGTLAFDLLPEAKANTPTLNANDAVTICWTSGTEARPKGVPRHHNHWVSAGIASVDAAKLEQGSVILNPFPFINMAAIGGSFVPWLLTGGTLVQHHPFDLPTFLKQIPFEKVNYTVAPPAVLTMLLKEEALLASLDLSSMRSIGSGSAPLPPHMVKEWQEKYGLPVINIFGSNEGTCLFSGVDDVPDPEERARYFPRFGCDDIAWPARIAGRIETKLVDLVSGATITEPGKPGELLLRGATVFEGYFGTGEPDAPANPFDTEGFFRTGDVFQIAGPGNRFYQFVERAKDIIIRGGMNISPTELDVLLAGHPDIAEASVVGIPDPVMGERICAVIVPKNATPPTLEAINNHLKAAGIAAYKLPEKIIIAEALPRNPLGKVLRRDLARSLQAG
ncbi:MAG: class I adenylate-forming enzyme family protein [Parvibaculum sp.]